MTMLLTGDNALPTAAPTPSTSISSSISSSPSPSLTLLRPRTIEPTRSRQLPTAALLARVDAVDAGHDLVPVGIALHSFTEPWRSLAEPGTGELHRTTAVLTKQVKALLTTDDRLAAIAQLTTDPNRIALPDGRTAAQVCGDAWPAVRAVAAQRSKAAIEGATTFGETAILRLAATRAALPACRWWGTAGWIEAVERWATEPATTGQPATGTPSRRTIAALLTTPELVSDEILVSVFDL
jgi:hypothetical protein